MVPPKKSKGGGTIPNQLLNKKEIKRIHDKVAVIAVDDDLKQTFERSFDQPKRNHASQVCDEAIAARNSAAKSTSTVVPLLDKEKQTTVDDSKTPTAEMKILSMEQTFKILLAPQDLPSRPQLYRHHSCLRQCKRRMPLHYRQ
jgi:hypothetical protein